MLSFPVQKGAKPHCYKEWQTFHFCTNFGPQSHMCAVPLSLLSLPGAEILEEWSLGNMLEMQIFGSIDSDPAVCVLTSPPGGLIFLFVCLLFFFLLSTAPLPPPTSPLPPAPAKAFYNWRCLASLRIPALRSREAPVRLTFTYETGVGTRNPLPFFMSSFAFVLLLLFAFISLLLKLTMLTAEKNQKLGKQKDCKNITSIA